MPDERNIPNGEAASESCVSATASSVFRVSTLAESALRARGLSDTDPVLQEALAARLVAEEALSLDEAGDPLADPLALEALRMAKGALKAALGGGAPEKLANACKPAPAPEDAPAEGDASAESTDSGSAAFVRKSDESLLREASVRGEEKPAASEALPREEGGSRNPRPRRIDLPEILTAPADSPAPAPASAAPPMLKTAQHGAAVASAGQPKVAKRVCAALACVLVVLAGLVGAAWWGLFDLPEPLQSRIELLPDAHATRGYLNATKTDVAPGSYQLVLNQVTNLDAGSRTLSVAFENPEANMYSSRLELSLDGERLAETGMVLPGFYVETVELARALPAGEHELSAAVYVYSGATQVNTMSVNVTVRVR